MDEKFMLRCIELAEKGKGYVSPNPLVGCTVVKDGQVLSEGYHHKSGEKHAEIDVLDKIKGKAQGATLYVNLEPCCFYGKTPPCTKRIISEGISEVVIGIRDPNPNVSGKGISELKGHGINVREGILKEESRMINQFYFKWIKTGLPYVTLKAAQTTDGFVAKLREPSLNITNIESRKEVHRLRSWYDAVLIGKNTVVYDNPSLTVRHVKGRHPKRIILDTHADIILNEQFENYKLLSDNLVQSTFWIVSDEVKSIQNTSVEIVRVSCTSSDHLDLKKVLIELGKRNITSILVEGGPHIWLSFLKKNLVDQVILFTSPDLFKEGIPSLPEGSFEDLKFEKTITRQFGKDNLIQGLIHLY